MIRETMQLRTVGSCEPPQACISTARTILALQKPHYFENKPGHTLEASNAAWVTLWVTLLYLVRHCSALFGLAEAVLFADGNHVFSSRARLHSQAERRGFNPRLPLSTGLLRKVQPLFYFRVRSRVRFWWDCSFVGAGSANRCAVLKYFNKRVGFPDHADGRPVVDAARVDPKETSFLLYRLE